MLKFSKSEINEQRENCYVLEIGKMQPLQFMITILRDNV